MNEQAWAFSTLVLEKVWQNTKRAFGSFQRDFGVAAIGIVAGGSVYAYFFGLRASLEQIVPILFFTLGPLVLIVLSVIVWVLLLAPAEVVFDSLLATQSGRPPQPPSRPDYAIWKKRTHLTIWEFAALLDDVDPGWEGQTNNQKAYQALLLEQADLKKLPYVADIFEPSIDAQVERDAALSWARQNGFNVDRLA